MHVLGADHPEELEPLVAFAAGGGGEHHECLGLVGVEQDLALQLKNAEFGVLDTFGALVGSADLVFGPQLAELGAGGEQRRDDGVGRDFFRRG